jgi:hypothetical protein
MPKKFQPAGDYWHLKVSTLKVNMNFHLDWPGIELRLVHVGFAVDKVAL